jgi:hypothetical protein
MRSDEQCLGNCAKVRLPNRCISEAERAALLVCASLPVLECWTYELTACGH